MPVRVTAAGLTAAHLTLDIGERQVLVGMDDEAEEYWHHLLLVRISDSRWVTCDPQLSIVAEDLAGEEIIPLSRLSAFPVVGRPLLALDLLDEAALLGIRLRGQALAEVHGITPAVGQTPTGPNT